MLPKNRDGCPYLILAPMEGVGDECFRRAMASIGGFDEGVRDFLRVPSNAHVQSLATRYNPHELQTIPLAAQIMGSDVQLMADMCRELEAKGALRIDLNCGCPSNTVTGRGAGSSLLKEPSHLHDIAKAMVESVSIPVTAKLRIGFDDTSLFRENILAAQESGISYLTLHPRTKVDGYGPPARWEYIAEAKSLLKIPVVGNGDILNVQDALRMISETKCDALMIGRGAVVNPFIFHEIKAHFSGIPYERKWEDLLHYFEVYKKHIPGHMTEKHRVSKMKQLFSFLFKANGTLLDKRQDILKSSSETMEGFIQFALNHLQEAW